APPLAQGRALAGPNDASHRQGRRVDGGVRKRAVRPLRSLQLGEALAAAGAARAVRRLCGLAERSPTTRCAEGAACLLEAEARGLADAGVADGSTAAGRAELPGRTGGVRA